MILQEITNDLELQKKIIKYSESPCKSNIQTNKFSFPLPDEQHVDDWRNYLRQKKGDDWSKLQKSIPQFNLPIVEGISKSILYSNIVYKGKQFDEHLFSKKFNLKHPDLFKCEICYYPAGSLPVLSTKDRSDFESLFRLLGYRSEPVKINPSVNALMVSGFNNWDRINKYRQGWFDRSGDKSFFLNWPKEMERVLKEEKWRFQDRFILVMAAPYSGVSAKELGINLSEDAWLEKSLHLRVEHEFTHYALKRIYNVMRVHVWDEIMADFMGIICALDDFKSFWLLRFLGLDNSGNILPNARLLHYTKNISKDLLQVICKLLIKTSHGLEKIYQEQFNKNEKMQFLLNISKLSLLEIADLNKCKT